MWKPTTAIEIQAALASLQESEVFDAKADVPGPRKAAEFAVDVSAMANDGGSIVYGIAEDKATGTFTAQPVVLAGQSERLSDAVHQLIQDPPGLRVWDVPLPHDRARGFLVVSVPASPMAPHMVKNTFWGRAGTINVKLSQGEVDRLYARRRIWEQEADAVLQSAIEETPSIGTTRGRGDLYLVAHPLLSDGGVLARSGLQVPERLAQALVDNTNSLRFRLAPAVPSALSILVNGRFAPTLGGVAYQFDGADTQDHYRLELLADGTVRFYWSGAAQLHPGQTQFTFHDSTCAQFTFRVMGLAGGLLHLVSYDGPTTTAVCVRGARGAVSDAWLEPDSQRANLGMVPNGRLPPDAADRRVRANRQHSRRCQGVNWALAARRATYGCS